MTDTREHITQTAMNLFLQKGFKEVTMKELVECAGLSKGAFYHYFTSKEKVFEVVVFEFYNGLKNDDYPIDTPQSLKGFYMNWVKNFGKKTLAYTSKKADNLSSNHYYILFDGLRLVPSFKMMIDEAQKKELKKWITVIDRAKQNGEIKPTPDSKTIAQMFMHNSDGVILNLMIQNDMASLKKETLKNWDALYGLIKA